MKRVKVIGIILLLLSIPDSVFSQEWSLDKCLQYAEEHNKELLAQAEAIHASNQSLKASQSRLFPEVNAIGQLDHYWKIPVQAFPAEVVGGEPGTFVAVPVGTPWTGSYGVEARVKLIDLHTWESTKLSRLEQQLQESQLGSLMSVLHKHVQIAFYNVLMEEENLEVGAQLYKTYQEIHQLLGLQFDRGLIDKIAFNQSAALLLQRQEARAQAEKALYSAYLDLKFWMGYPLKDSLRISGTFPDPVKEIPNLNFQLLPDYKVERLRLEQAKQQWKVARTGFLPTLAGVGNYQRISFGNSFGFLQDGEWFNIGSVGIQLQVPLLSLRQMVHEPTRQKAFWQQASYQFERFQEEQEKRYLQEKAALGLAFRSWQNQEKRLQLAHQNEQLALTKIDKGIIDMVQLRQIQEDLFQARQKLNHERLEYLRHYVELEYMQNN